jgi:hypothetical protein
MKLSLGVLIQTFASPPPPRPQGIIIVLSTGFSDTVSLCHSLNVRDQFSHPYRQRGKIKVCHLIFVISGSK